MDPSGLSSLPEEEDDPQLHDDTSKPPSAFSSSSIPVRPASQTSLQKYAPLDWSGHFDSEVDISIPGTNNVFHVYMAGSEGPVVFCLHGGGYTGLSFALAASNIKGKARVAAMDLRGHGKSSTDNDLDLSIETLCNDVLAVLKEMYGETSPAIVLIGHSMGGSVAVHAASKKELRNIFGLIVVDVVEGTAMASLIHMQKILSSRMQHFRTLEKAINAKWQSVLLRDRGKGLTVDSPPTKSPEEPLDADPSVVAVTHQALAATCWSSLFRPSVYRHSPGTRCHLPVCHHLLHAAAAASCCLLLVREGKGRREVTRI